MVGIVSVDAILLFRKNMEITRKSFFFFPETSGFLPRENISPENSIFPYYEFSMC